MMKRKVVLKGLMIGVCVLSFSGCGMGQAEGQGEKDMFVTAQHQNDIEDMPFIEDGKDNINPETNDEDGNRGQSLSNEGASAEKQNNTTANDTDGKVDADSLYTSAAMAGSVVDFSDDGCTVSAIVTGEDGKTAIAAAPGYESDDTNIAVTYQEGCVVQVATIYTSTGIAELEQASVEDIKKQASVIVYGSFEDTHHVTATKIIICHRTA